MIVPLIIGGGALALVAALSRRAPAQAPIGSEARAAPPQAPAAVTTTAPRQPRPDGKAADGLDLGSSAGILAAGGVIGGLLGKEVAYTSTGKDIALPVGLGVAAAAYLATTLGGMAVIGVTGVAVAGAAAAGYLLAPVVVITVNLVFVIDGIVRAIEVGEWPKLVKEIVALRAQGRYREALAVWEEGSKKVSPIARIWPVLGDDWYNINEPNGRPYPGFPGAPARAEAADVAKFPSIVPETIATQDGKEIVIRSLLEALRADVAECRAWGLANGVPGTVIIDGKTVTVTKGDRDIRAWPPLAERAKNLADWAKAIALAVPWLGATALEGYRAVSTTQAERDVSRYTANVSQQVQVSRTATRMTLAAAQLYGTTAPTAEQVAQATAEVAQIQEEGQEDRFDRKTGRTGSDI